MIFSKTVTSTHGGSSASTTVNVLKVTEGFVYQFELYFPPGSAGLLKVRIGEHGHVLWPWTPGEWLFGDGITVSYPESYLIGTPPYEILIEHYNEDDTYDHLFQLRLGIVTEELFIGRFLPQMAAEQYGAVIERILAAQQTAAQARAEEGRAILAEFGLSLPEEGEGGAG